MKQPGEKYGEASESAELTGSNHAKMVMAVEKPDPEDAKVSFVQLELPARRVVHQIGLEKHGPSESRSEIRYEEQGLQHGRPYMETPAPLDQTIMPPKEEHKKLETLVPSPHIDASMTRLQLICQDMRFDTDHQPQGANTIIIDSDQPIHDLGHVTPNGNHVQNNQPLDLFGESFISTL